MPTKKEPLLLLYTAVIKENRVCMTFYRSFKDDIIIETNQNNDAPINDSDDN